MHGLKLFEDKKLSVLLLAWLFISLCVLPPHFVILILVCCGYCILSYALTVDGATTNSMKENSVSSFEMIDGEEGFDVAKEQNSGMFLYRYLQFW